MWISVYAGSVSNFNWFLPQCKKVADEIKKCKTPDDIRDRFNIRQDYTPEEVEEVKRAHPWIYDRNAK